MATAYFFRAVAADGKLRTGTLSAETDRHVANELKRQGIDPGGGVGLEQKAGAAIKMPAFNGRASEATFCSSHRNWRRC